MEESYVEKLNSIKSNAQFCIDTIAKDALGENEESYYIELSKDIDLEENNPYCETHIFGIEVDGDKVFLLDNDDETHLLDDDDMSIWVLAQIADLLENKEFNVLEK